MNGVYEITQIGIAFAGVVVMVATLYWVSRRAGPTKSGRQRIFTCGEDEAPERVNVLENGFFEQVGRALGITYIRQAHNGDLSNYLTWIFIGMLALIMVMVIYW